VNTTDSPVPGSPPAPTAPAATALAAASPGVGAPHLSRPERSLPHLPLATLGGLALVGLSTDLALRTGFASVIGCIAVLVVAAVLIRTGTVQSPLGRVALLMAVLLSLWLPLRSSPWLIAPNVVGIIALVVAAPAVERISGWSITLPRIFGLLPRLAHAVFGPVAVVKSIFAGGRGLSNASTGALIRGIAIAAVPVTILVALLASADAVFASVFSFASFSAPATLGSALGHGFIAGLVAVATAGLMVVAHAEVSSVGDGEHRRWLGAIESTVLLGSMVVVYGAFVVTQVVTALGGAEHVLETAGLTRAEYARSGFFQMLAAAALTLALLFIVQTYGANSERRAAIRQRALSVACSVLTIVVVAVSISRLGLYADAFGLTMLRLYSTVSAAFVGVVFVLFIADLLTDATQTSRRHWFLPAMALVGWGLLMGLNAVSPEAYVADRNLERQTGTFDYWYAANLSGDAVPTLFDGLSDQAPDGLAGAELEIALCDRWAHTDHAPDYGPLGFNRSIARAVEAAEVCP